MGDTPVSCVVTDSSGNSNQCSFIMRLTPKLEPPFGLSTGTVSGNPDLAYNSVRNTWLAVWNEGNALYPDAGRPFCRLMDSAGQTLTTPVALGISGKPPVRHTSPTIR